MCLAIPSKIISIKNQIATIDVAGVRREASLALVEEAKKGDYVIVHAGYALSILDEKEALASLELIREAFASHSDS